jgi:ferritin-like metal-binding protein YciE
MIHHRYDKFVLYLNDALSMENTAIKRLQIRLKEVRLQDFKQRLQQHLDETREQQRRLQQFIIDIGGTPTEERLGLPLPSYPRSMKKLMKNSMTPEEWELKKTEEDMIIENAEIIRYNMIVQKAQIMNIGDAVPLLRQSLLEEESMAAWLKSITPVMITHLWPK